MSSRQVLGRYFEYGRRKNILIEPFICLSFYELKNKVSHDRVSFVPP